MKRREHRYWILATLLFLALFGVGQAEECCSKEITPCCCSPATLGPAGDCVPSICDGQDLGAPRSNVALLSPVLYWGVIRVVTIELQPEVALRPQVQRLPVLSDDRPPPLYFLDKTLFNLPPPA